MLSNGAFGTGISARKRANDLSDFADELDMLERLGVESIELPTYDMDIVVGGRIRRAQMETLKRACAGRSVAFTVHGPLAVNFMDEPWRLPRHADVLAASLEVAAEVGAVTYVVHAGLAPDGQAAGIEAAHERQRQWLSRAGDVARTLGITLCVETLFSYGGKRRQTDSPARLALELGTIAHPNVMATIDFSHSYIHLDFEGRRAELVAEAAALAPYARHLHMHDSFGRQDDIWMYTDGERLAYGHGDLHLPVGWGDIPWDALMDACTFPEGVIFNIELEQRYRYAAAECVEATKRLAASARVRRSVAAAE